MMILKDGWQKRSLRYAAVIVLSLLAFFFVLSICGNVVHAVSLVDDTVDVANEYSRYGIDNYQLDFYVNNSWAWLPWNWSDGIGKSVMYGLYAITNGIWFLSLVLSNGTGFLVQEAYNLDFIDQTADAIGKNIQTIAGVSENGFSNSGFYVGFLLILVLILGIYVAYTGVLKRETSKAIQAVINFVVVFILSASFIAYAPSYIGAINEFSSDLSRASLDVGTRIVMPNSETEGKDSVDMIRDSLFSIQVKQPWLLLEYGSTDVDEARADKLLSVSPNTNNGEDRETIVVDEIENMDNANLSISKVIPRLGTVFFLFFFNLGISFFVLLLCGVMIFSQVLFIIFAMFLPISFLLSMIPGFGGMAKKSIMKLFNVIMTRAGITLIITVAFSISTMLYSLASSSPFFLVMFLQVVTFAGIYFKLGDIMHMFSLQDHGAQGLGGKVFSKPRRALNRLGRQFSRRLSSGVGGGLIGYGIGKNASTVKKTAQAPQVNRSPDTVASESSKSAEKPKKQSAGVRAGNAIGKVMDAKNLVADKASDLKDGIKAAPTNIKYAAHKGKRDLVSNARDLATSVDETKRNRQKEREQNRQVRQSNLAQKRLDMDKGRVDTSRTTQTKASSSPNVPEQRSRNNIRSGVDVKRQATVPKQTHKPVTRENHQVSQERTVNRSIKRNRS